MVNPFITEVLIPQVLFISCFYLFDTLTNLKNLPPLFTPIRYKTKTDRDLLSHIFLRFALFTFIFFKLILIGLWY